MNVLQQILVPIDGRETSLHAIDFAIGLAKYTDAGLIFVHSVDVTGAVAACTDAYAIVDVGPIIESLEAQCKTALRDAAERAHRAGIRATTLEAGGPPIDAIVDVIAQQNVDAVVMGTHARSAAADFFLGSTVLGVLHRVHVPVFVVPAAAENRHGDGSAFTSIEVAFDASDLASAALTMAFHVAAPGTTALFLAHVAEGRDAAAIHADRDSVRASLGAAVQRATDAGLAAKALSLEGSAVRGILDASRSNAVDLIAIGTHGRRGLDRLMLGSIAEGVLRGSAVPVLIVPAVAAQASTQREAGPVAVASS